MGRHLVSIRGIQRRLRSVLKSESRTADLVRLVEKEIIDWIYQVTVWEPHGSQQTRVVDNQLPHEDSQEASILELERSTSRLKWWVQEPFTRFLVHLVARLWDVASASEFFRQLWPAGLIEPFVASGRTEADGRRTTTLLRPNTLHTDPAQQRGAPGAMATPPTTEWEASSMTGSMLRSSDSSDFSDLDDGPLSPWQIIHRRGTVSNDTVQSSEDEAEGNATITAAGEPLRRMVSASSDAHSEFGDDEATAGAMAASIERASLYETK